MKLLYCKLCDDIFTLRFHLKSCDCGQVKGRYDDNGETAVVNGKGVSIVMGSGSFVKAICNANNVTSDWRANKTPWYKHYVESGDNMILAWTRPHTGPANNKTRVDPNL